MKAVFFHKDLVVRDYPDPKPKTGEVIVKVLVAGICNTDIEIIRGYKAGFRGVLGHEFVGRLEDPVEGFMPGQRVVGEINYGCGICSYCLRGMQRHCPHRNTLGISSYWGAMAEYVQLPMANIHAVPNNVSDEEAVFTEPLAAACEILEQIHIEPSHKVAVVGDGKLGTLIFQVLKLTGCDLVLIGKHTDRMDLLDLVPGKGFILASKATMDLDVHTFDIVVEATGNPEGLQMALDFVRPRGTIVLKSTFHENVDIDTSSIVVNEITIVGSRCGLFSPALRLLSQKLVSVKPMISANYAMDNAVEAFRYATSPGTLKVLLWPAWTK